MKNTFIPLMLLLGMAASCTPAQKNEIIACGDDKFMVIDLDASTEDNVEMIWTWCSAGSDLPDDYERYFKGIDECKSVNDGKWVLITSSSAGAAIIERPSGKCIFYAGALGGAHSIELLPDDRLVVARSGEAGGLDIFDREVSDKILATCPFAGGHGVIWIESRQLLYAIGDYELRAYSLEDWNTDSPKLKLEKTWELPTIGGHDLNRINDSRLGFTTVYGTYEINLDTEEITPFAPLKDVLNVKSFNYNEKTGSLVYTKAEIEWWTHHVYSENPDKVMTVDSVNMYKVRPVIYE